MQGQLTTPTINSINVELIPERKDARNEAGGQIVVKKKQGESIQESEPVIVD